MERSKADLELGIFFFKPTYGTTKGKVMKGLTRGETNILFSKSRKLTTDEWAERHPLFLKNVQASVKMLASTNDPQAHEDLVRHVMIFARQEFEPHV